MHGLGRTIVTHSTALWRAGVDFVYPPACACCSVPLEPESEIGGVALRRLCDGCRNSLARPIPNRCARCSAPVGPYLDTSQG